MKPIYRDSKTCNSCKEELPLSSFHINSQSADGRQRKCIECAKQRYREYYQETRAEHLDRASRYVAANRERVDEILSKNPCVDCGYSDIRALDFDHVRGEKVNHVKAMLGRKWSAIEEEIAKCEVRCANCHRIVTLERLKTK